MSSRQERELAMRNSIITALARVVLAACEFVDSQAELARGDFYGERFRLLELQLKALMSNAWARELLTTMKKDPSAVVG